MTQSPNHAPQLPVTVYDGHITMSPEPRTVRVTIAGTVVAESRDAIHFHEGTRPAIHYIPISDVNMAAFVPSDHHTRCKWKGDASYHHYSYDGQKAENAFWAYPEARDEVAAIRNHVSFDLTVAEVTTHD